MVVESRGTRSVRLRPEGAGDERRERTLMTEWGEREGQLGWGTLPRPGIGMSFSRTSAKRDGGGQANWPQEWLRGGDWKWRRILSDEKVIQSQNPPGIASLLQMHFNRRGIGAKRPANTGSYICLAKAFNIHHLTWSLSICDGVGVAHHHTAGRGSRARPWNWFCIKTFPSRITYTVEPSFSTP